MKPTAKQLEELANRYVLMTMMVDPPVTKKALVQARIPVFANDIEYPSICAMMKAIGIPDQAKLGLDNNWAKIRNSLKKNGQIIWTINEVEYLIHQAQH
jgi:hypothetical protein